MKTESLIFRNVSAENAPSSKLENVSFTLYQGEILGIYGISRRRKALFFDLISGRQLPSHGKIHRYYAPASPENGCVHSWNSDVVMLSSKGSQLFDDMSVWENLMIFQSANHRKIFFQPREIKSRVLEYLQQYLPDITPDTYVYELTRTQRFILEILKARLANSRFLVLDDASFQYNSAEHTMLKKLLLDSAEAGASFVLVSYNVNVLLNICHRIAFFHEGTLLRYIENTPGNASMIQEILPSSIPVFSPQLSAYESTQDTTYRLDNILVGKVPISISLQSRKITVFYDPQRQSLRAIVKGITSPNSGCQISLNGAQPKNIHTAIRRGEFCYLQFEEGENSLTSNLLIEDTSITNNICFSFFKQISTASFLHRNSVQFMMNEFVKWSGMKDLSPDLYCSELSSTAKIFLSFFKLYMSKPSVIIFKCPSSISDSNFLLINQILEEFALKYNCAVAFLIPEIASFPPIADLFYATENSKAFHQTSRAALCDSTLMPLNKWSVTDHE